MYATGTYNKNCNSYRMHSPNFPYDPCVFVGYTENEMKKRYREMYNLKGKKIEWIILGKEENND